MNKNFNNFFESHVKVLFVILFLFSIAGIYTQPIIGTVELIVTLAILLFSIQNTKNRNKRLKVIVADALSSVENNSKNAFLDSPLPMAMFRLENGEVVWANDKFFEIIGRSSDDGFWSDLLMTSVIPDFEYDWISEGQSYSKKNFRVNDRDFSVYGSVTDKTEKSNEIATTYWVDVTETVALKRKCYDNSPVICIILIDNYEDLIANMPDSIRSGMRMNIENILNKWLLDKRTMLCRYDRDRYILLLEKSAFEELKDNKFTILDDAHNIVNRNGVCASFSIGVGIDGNFEEMFNCASLSIDMALSRGGDQVVIKDTHQFYFYGGRSRESERRTRVKSRVYADMLKKLIQTSSQVFIMGHKIADFDAVGSAVGVSAVTRNFGVPSFIIEEENEVPGSQLVRSMKKIKEYEDVFIHEDEALQTFDNASLLVVVDTNRPGQVCSQALLKKAGKIVIIDHHKRANEYIDNAVLNYHEIYASSASELVTEIIQYVIEPRNLLRQEAEALLVGMVLDTKNFTLRTGGRTFEAAAFLRRCGADTVEAQMYFRNNLEETVLKYDIMRNAIFFHDNIAVAATDKAVGRIIAAQAADGLLNVSGVSASFVLYSDDNTIYISGRSSGDINVQIILEYLGGGGNSAAAGAQIKNCSLNQAVFDLKMAIDKYFK